MYYLFLETSPLILLGMRWALGARWSFSKGVSASRRRVFDHSVPTIAGWSRLVPSESGWRSVSIVEDK